mgnify:CR=1 FL=1
MPDKKRKNLRIVCLCGQRMKITPAMYGKAAKCVSCHQKFFLPDSGEISPGMGMLYLKDHKELLRRTGIFERGAPNTPEKENARQGKHFPTLDPSPEPEFDPSPILTPPKRTGAPASCDSAPELPAASVEMTADSNPGDISEDLPGDSCGSESADSPSPIRLREKKPFDILEPLRLLCSYQNALDELECQVLATEDSSAGTPAVDAYRRSLDAVWDRLRDMLKKAHESTQRQLTGIETEINRVMVAFRVGEINLAQYMKQTAQIRASREGLVRYAHHLVAWQRVEDPFLSGGLMDVDLDSFDAENFVLKLPPCPELPASQTLSELYTRELRDAMRTRAGIEVRLAEWKRIQAERSGSSVSDDITYKEFTAAHKRIDASLCFYRQRLQALLSDAGQDLDALHKYRRDVLERDRKGQIKNGSKDSLLKDIDNAESALLRVEAHIRKTLHANSAMEVPTPDIPSPGSVPTPGPSTFWSYEQAFYLTSIVFLLAGLFLLFLRGTNSVARLLLLFPMPIVLVQPSILFIRKTAARFVSATALFFLQAVVIALCLTMFFQIASPLPAKEFLLGLDAIGIVFMLGFFFSGAALGSVAVARKGYGPLRKLFTVLFCAFFISSVVFFSYPSLSASDPEAYSQSKTPGQGNALITPDPNEAQQATNAPEPVHNTETDSIGSEADTGSDNAVGDAVEGEDNSVSAILPDEHSVYFSLVGVVHKTGTPPRFRAAIQSSVGDQIALTLQLGDVITGEWKALEYHSDSKKLTITNGEKLLLLAAGDRVLIDDYVSETEGETSSE